MPKLASGDRIVIPAGTKMQVDPVYAIMTGEAEVYVVSGNDIYVQLGKEFFRMAAADVVKYDEYMKEADNGANDSRPGAGGSS